MNLLVAALTIAASTASVSPQPPAWMSDYGAALEATREANKPLLVLIDRPADPSEGSQEAVLDPEDQTLADLLDDYTLCYVDATTEYGQRVAEVFRVPQYPFAAVIDSDGRKILDKWTGSRAAWEWTAALNGNGNGNGTGYRRIIPSRYTVRPSSGRTASRACYT